MAYCQNGLLIMTTPTTSDLLSFLSSSNDYRPLNQELHNPNPLPAFENLSINYLNLIRPQHIHYIGHHESTYLATRSPIELGELIEKLHAEKTIALLFHSDTEIPATLTNQQNFIISHTNLNLTQLNASICNSNVFNKIFVKSLHGSLVVVYNQGILITGKSGTGKSSLLLELVDKGHLWVADDSPLLTLNNEKIIGHAEATKLSNFVHIKGFGVINMDNEYGRSRQLKSHKISAIFELADDTATDEDSINLLNQEKSVTIFKQKLPKWSINRDIRNLPLLVEKCAHRLILKTWEKNAPEQFNDALNRLITSSEK